MSDTIHQAFSWRTCEKHCENIAQQRQDHLRALLLAGPYGRVDLDHGRRKFFASWGGA